MIAVRCLGVAVLSVACADLAETDDDVASLSAVFEAADFRQLGVKTGDLDAPLSSGAFAFAGLRDWDRDGHQDIVARDNATADLWLYPGTSTRGWGGSPRVRIGTFWNGLTFAGVSDWDRDGHQDIVVRDDANGDLWLYPGTSTRGPGGFPRVLIGTFWNTMTFAGLADWDRDGHQDIVARDNSNGDLWLYPGTSTRGPGGAPRVLLGTFWNTLTFAGVGDWDRDGHQDLIARDDSNGNLWLYPGTGTRGPSGAPGVLIGTFWNIFTFAGVTDWDRDSHQDIIARDNSTRDLWLYPGTSTRGPGGAPRVLIGTFW